MGVVACSGTWSPCAEKWSPSPQPEVSVGGRVLAWRHKAPEVSGYRKLGRKARVLVSRILCLRLRCGSLLFVTSVCGSALLDPRISYGTFFLLLISILYAKIVQLGNSRLGLLEYGVHA